MRIIRKSVSLAALLLLAFLVIPQNGAHGSSWMADSCRGAGVVNMFASSQENIDPVELMETTNKFRTSNCVKDGMRLYRAQADTIREVSDLRQFASENRHTQPVVFCKTGRDSGYLLDLAYFYTLKIQSMSPLEKRAWKTWADRYARLHGCQTFSS